MIIDINQNKISARAEYKIYLNKTEKYTANKSWFRSREEIKVFDLNNSQFKYRSCLKFFVEKKQYFILLVISNLLSLFQKSVK